MDREANLSIPEGFAPSRFNPNLHRPITNSDTTTSSSSSVTSSSSSPRFIRQVHAAFKRHRPHDGMQSNGIMARRVLVPQRVTSKTDSSSSTAVSASSSDVVAAAKKFHDISVPSSEVKATNYSSSSTVRPTKNPVVRETQEDASITPPSLLGTTASTKTFDESFNQSHFQRNESKPAVECKERKVQFSTANNATSQGADHQMATGLENLSSHMSSLAFTEMEWDTSNAIEASNVINDESKHQSLLNIESDVCLRSNGAASFLAKRAVTGQDQLHQLRNFLSQPTSQSCVTTTSVHSASAPILNSTTYCSRSNPGGGAQVAVESMGDCNANSQHTSQKNTEYLSYPSFKDTSGMLIDRTATAGQSSITSIDTKIKEYQLPKEKQGSPAKGTDTIKDLFYVGENETKERKSVNEVADVPSQVPSANNLPSDVKLEPAKPEKQEKVTASKSASVSRKKNYDPDVFFKVNGKLYQRLGKIGSGGSSEVHKVISSDCTIYALKKIKLKGRDYATAYGFCQEILYLNKLKGKNNIIQLIDYEVTDKSLLREVMNESMNNKDGRVKQDGFIYMVLEYGEIDLAHMLSQKWKEMDDSNQTIDENWLRFYWQQILQAVNTIHEERIVHSDLKPANFLLVKGFLKLIDFGIAKAIMSDTTNIQRDSQVGTLSYMSPEAFMCNECDANGNTIKCGRPSDIWSLGCILYQMVYGRTPFAEYKTFWQKFKVITDPNHEITYEPVPNPWLLDLMKKCLAWDRNERWRIPQLLQHPFLVPPNPAQPTTPQEKDCKLLQLLAEACCDNQEASKLLSDLRQLLNDPVTSMSSLSLTSQNKQCKLLSQMSMLSFQLKECLAKSDKG